MSTSHWRGDSSATPGVGTDQRCRDAGHVDSTPLPSNSRAIRQSVARGSPTRSGHTCESAWLRRASMVMATVLAISRGRSDREKGERVVDAQSSTTPKSRDVVRRTKDRRASLLPAPARRRSRVRRRARALLATPLEAFVGRDDTASRDRGARRRRRVPGEKAQRRNSDDALSSGRLTMTECTELEPGKDGLLGEGGVVVACSPSNSSGST